MEAVVIAQVSISGAALSLHSCWCALGAPLVLHRDPLSNRPPDPVHRSAGNSEVVQGSVMKP